jgi:tetratricopeptide (TPR) repeat protein
MKTLVIFTLTCMLGINIYAQTTKPAAKNAHDESIESYIMASKYLKAQKYAEASIFLDKAIAKDPTNQLFLYERGKCYLNLKNYDKALYCFRRATEIKANYADAYLMIAYIYSNSGKNKEAIAEYEKAYLNEESPASRLAQKLSIITLLDKEGLLKDAEKHIADAKALGIENPLLYYYDGKAKNIHKKYKEAKESLLRAIASLDNNIQNVANQQVIKLPTAKSEEELAAKRANNLLLPKVEDAKLSHSNNSPKEQAKYYFELYFAYYHLNQYNESQKLLPYLEAEPYKSKIKTMNINYLYAVAYAHYLVYDLNKCQHVLKQVLQKDKHHKGSHHLLVKISELKTDKTLLINQLEQAIASIKDPFQKDKMQHDLLILDIEKGDYDKAITIANQITAVKSDDHNTLFLKAIALEKLGKNEEAIKVLQSVIAMKGLDQKTLSEYEFELGLIAEKMNDVALATDAFKHTTYMYFRTAALEELKNVEQLSKSNAATSK